MEIRELAPESYAEEGLGGLLETPEYPERLWLQGTLAPIGTTYLTVVGSRALSRYGKEACERLISGLAGYPVSIVSGLALGADACAHRAALAAGLHTVAIPGGGLSEIAIAPRTNLSLAREILKSGGTLLSEHPPDYLAHPYDFAARNRIMVGLARAVLLIEAGERSGTLITARLSGDYNRELLCVPHRLNDPHGYGAERFVRLGATLVTKSEHILEALGIEAAAPAQKVQASREPLSGLEAELFALLTQEKSRDELMRGSTRAAHEVLTALAALELKGLAREEYGVWRHV